MWFNQVSEKMWIITKKTHLSGIHTIRLWKCSICGAELPFQESHDPNENNEPCPICRCGGK